MLRGAYTVQEIENWIFKSLVNDDEFLSTDIFEKSEILYSTSLSNNFVATIINGSGQSASYKVAPPGQSQYNFIIRQVAEATESEPAFWFYYTVIDNAIGNINGIWENNYSYCLDSQLEKFELEPAKEGGVSYLGLVGESRKWLLLHMFEPSESFNIKFCSSQTNVGNLLRRLPKCI